MPASQAGFTTHRNAPEQSLVARLAVEQAMLERTCVLRGYIDYSCYFMSIVHAVQWEVERSVGVRPEVTAVVRTLREGLAERDMPPLKGRFETAHGLTDLVDIMQGLGQGCLLSPSRANMTLAIAQRAVSRLCGGFTFRADGRDVPQLYYADDGALLAGGGNVGEATATLQLAFECTWLVSQILGLKMSIKGKRKTAWCGTYWSGGLELDISGWEIRLPNGDLVPQLRADEMYKYLGTELASGWHDGRAHVALRKKAVRKCRQLIGMIGRVPRLRQDQMSKGMSLAIAGVIGYYARSTVLTWADCVQIEQARAAALRAAGYTTGVPRVQMYKTPAFGGMNHEHAYAYASAALCDQIDRALSGGDGEPARIAVEDALASTCARLGGGRKEHPLDWWPTHLSDELRDDLIIEAYLKASMRLERRSLRTIACDTRDGPLAAATWATDEIERRYLGPLLWEQDKWDGVSTRPCVFSRELAALGVATWADVTVSPATATAAGERSRRWITWPEFSEAYGAESKEHPKFTALIAQPAYGRRTRQRS